jgi:hypothetical protein
MALLSRDLHFLRDVGVIQMSTILSQATAPAFSTSLFAYSIKSDLAGGHLVWVVCFIISASRLSLFIVITRFSGEVVS